MTGELDASVWPYVWAAFGISAALTLAFVAATWWRLVRARKRLEELERDA